MPSITIGVFILSNSLPIKEIAGVPKFNELDDILLKYSTLG